MFIEFYFCIYSIQSLYSFNLISLFIQFYTHSFNFGVWVEFVQFIAER